MQVLREMPTNSLEVLGRGRVQQQPSTQADRLIASKRFEKLSDDLGVERRMQLICHARTPQKCAC
jgi:hypothetical protein